MLAPADHDDGLLLLLPIPQPAVAGEDASEGDAPGT
jgi:hypothetical protein